MSRSIREDDPLIYGIKPSLPKRLLGEIIGTSILVGFGVGCVMSNKYLFQGPIQDCGFQFGFALTICITMFGNLSGAHFNPAISLAFAMIRPSEMPIKELVGFVIAQYVGAILGVGFIAMYYQGIITQYENDLNLPYRGKDSIQPLALYWADGMHEGTAFLSELWATFMLSMNIFFLTTARMKKQFSLGNGIFFPVYIGIVLYMLINIIGAPTGCCLNPARDFGPRVVATFSGFGGDISFQGKH